MLKMTAIVGGSKLAGRLKAVQKSWEDALKEEGKTIKGLYEKTTSTWDTDVVFNTKVKFGRDEMYVDVWAKNRIYWFVHESISVMRGVLSPDWSPKTQPRVLASGAGSGRLLYASKKISKSPYEAREFTEKIIEEREKPFHERMKKATRAGVVRALTGK
ncbi:MAG: hypothetical protein ACYSWU_02060 [Planctomycetota bacterium]|jgi:hypothetical protein